jgi:hypothetical protein
MKIGYVINIYDSLNLDIFIKDYDKQNDILEVINERFTYCSTSDIMDPCLYDTSYCTSTKKPIVIENVLEEDKGEGYAHHVNNVKAYNTLLKTRDSEKTNVCEGQSYRCHMKDLRFRTNSKIHHDFNISKKLLIEWTDYTNGYVLVDVFRVDTYNRLIVELYDPFTKESFKTYLMTNFPTIFCYYQQQAVTVKLSEMNISRPIPRPKSFQIKDYVHIPFKHN